MTFILFNAKLTSAVIIKIKEVKKIHKQSRGYIHVRSTPGRNMPGFFFTQTS